MQESVDAISDPSIVGGISPPLGSTIKINEWGGATFVDLAITVLPVGVGGLWPSPLTRT
jgi:hypothetical protein